MRFLVFAILLLAASCGPSGPPPNIDPALSSCIPEGAQILAGLQLQRLRGSPLYAHLPAAVSTMLDQLRSASDVLVSMNGSDMLVVAHGDFREPAAGATLLDSHLMLYGSPAAIEAAKAGHKRRRPVAKELLARADPLARTNQIWIVALGTASLPVAGDIENVNRLLHLTEYSTITANLGTPLEIQASGICRSPEDARRLEETLRAFVSLSVLGASRRQDIATLLRSMQVTRENSAVRLTLSAPPDEIGAIIQYLAR